MNLQNESMYVVYLQQDIMNQYKKGQPQTIRQVFKDSITNNLLNSQQFTMFKNFVTDDYPNLAQLYQQVVKFPVSVKQIIERLNSNVGTVIYQYIGDIIQAMLLLPHNCRLFNTEPQILGICTQLEDCLLTMINEIIKKQDVKMHTFKTFSDLLQQTFHLWPPGKVPSSVQSLKKKYRTPYREEVDSLVYRFARLSNIRQTQLVMSLAQELEQCRFNQQGQLINQSLNIDFYDLKPPIFWWFYDITIETYAQELGSDQERKTAEEIRQLQSSKQEYVNINEQEEKDAIIQVIGKGVEIVVVDDNQNVQNTEEVKK